MYQFSLAWFKMVFVKSLELTNALRDDANKKKIGVFKDDTNGLVIKNVLALNPKVYSFNYQTIDEFNEVVIKNKKTLKGVSKSVVENEITHQDYKNVLDTAESIKRDVTSIRSIDHQLYTYKHPKVALTSYYDKMQMVNSLECVPYGYNPI